MDQRDRATGSGGRGAPTRPVWAPGSRAIPERMPWTTRMSASRVSGPTSSAGRPMPDGRRPTPGGWSRGRGGLSRERFWIPAHLAFELALVSCLVALWTMPSVRTPLLVGLASHVLMRLWSAVDFISQGAGLRAGRAGLHPAGGGTGLDPAQPGSPASRPHHLWRRARRAGSGGAAPAVRLAPLGFA